MPALKRPAAHAGLGVVPEHKKERRGGSGGGKERPLSLWASHAPLRELPLGLAGPPLPRRISFHLATRPDAHTAPLPPGVLTLVPGAVGPGSLAGAPGTGASPHQAKERDPGPGDNSLAARNMDLARAAAQASPGAPPPPADSCLAGVQWRWPQARPIGAGLSNLGNTCFLNSVLQCLSYTPGLADFLTRHSAHQPQCPVPGWCALCEMTRHVRQALAGSGRSIAPHGLVKNLRSVSRLFRPGRQEDAHEYMRGLLEAMHRCLLPPAGPAGKRAPAAAHRLADTFMHQAFGGYLRSQVQCTECSFCSRTYDPFLDLSLDIFKATSVQRALERFTMAEVLEGSEKYRCSKCNKKVRALKSFSVEAAPRVLTLHLKRFAIGGGGFGMGGGFGGAGRKIDRWVEFGTTLDLSPFLSSHNPSFQKHSPAPKEASGDARALYSLHGVLVHSGGSLHSGHYYCFVKGPSGHWHCLDDSRVTQVSEATVLKQKAYILFYTQSAAAAAWAPPASRPSPHSQSTPAREGEHPAAENGEARSSTSTQGKATPGRGQEEANPNRTVVSESNASRPAERRAGAAPEGGRDAPPDCAPDPAQKQLKQPTAQSEPRRGNGTEKGVAVTPHGTPGVGAPRSRHKAQWPTAAASGETDGAARDGAGGVPEESSLLAVTSQERRMAAAKRMMWHMRPLLPAPRRRYASAVLQLERPAELQGVPPTSSLKAKGKALAGASESGDHIARALHFADSPAAQERPEEARGGLLLRREGQNGALEPSPEGEPWRRNHETSAGREETRRKRGGDSGVEVSLQTPAGEGEESEEEEEDGGFLIAGPGLRTQEGEIEGSEEDEEEGGTEEEEEGHEEGEGEGEEEDGARHRATGPARAQVQDRLRQEGARATGRGHAGGPEAGPRGNGAGGAPVVVLARGRGAVEALKEQAASAALGSGAVGTWGLGDETAWTGAPAQPVDQGTPRRKYRYDDWDAELDKGRVKKVKRKEAQAHGFHEVENPFQSFSSQAKKPWKGLPQKGTR